MSGNIFINYRRGDEPGFVQALLGRLEQSFPSEQLFIDVDHIPPGEDFVAVLGSKVAACDTLLAVIGQSWLSATDDGGHRRLDDPNDLPGRDRTPSRPGPKPAGQEARLVRTG